MNKEIIQELIEKGFSGNKIAKYLNTSQTNIRYWLKKYKLSTGLLPYTKKEIIDGKGFCKKHGITEYSKTKRCRECGIEAVIRVRRRNKQRAVDYKGGSCKKCGYNKCMAALEFHHIDPSQKEPNGLSNRSWERIKIELDKCILVCANCHREIHNNPL